MATSIISNTVTDLSGVVVGGVTVTAKLVPGSSFRTATFTEVASMVTTTSDVNGNWALVLERNSDVVPSGTYYVVTEKIPDAKGGSKSYTIQVGAANTTLLASLVTPIAAPTLVTDSFLTQAAADARYFALSGGFGGSAVQDSQTSSTGGIATSASRSDHQHQDPTATPRGRIATLASLNGVDQAGITAEVDITGLTLSPNLDITRRYRVIMRGAGYGSAGGLFPAVKIKIGATVINATIFGPVDNVEAQGYTLIGEIAPGTFSGVTVVRGTMLRQTGAGTVVHRFSNGGGGIDVCSMVIDDIGI